MSRELNTKQQIIAAISIDTVEKYENMRLDTIQLYQTVLS